MRAVLPGRPQSKLQALSTVLWDGLRIVAYISGHALVILSGARSLLQTIYIDDAEDPLEAVAVHEATGRIAVCGGSHVFVYHPNGFKGEALKWSLVHTFRSDDDNDGKPISCLSWGSADELLVAHSNLALWHLNPDGEPRLAWKKKLARPAKIARFSPDGELVASTGQYDRLVKLWRRLAFGAQHVSFEVFYLPHPSTVTGIHWRTRRHRQEATENVLYTFCTDNKIRIWTSTESQALSAMRLWAEIDMTTSVPSPADSGRRYGFVIDGGDLAAAAERAVLRSAERASPSLEHLAHIAQRGQEVCVVVDDDGHMCAWGLDNVGSKDRGSDDVFKLLQAEGLKLSFPSRDVPMEDYTQFYTFEGSAPDGSLSILVHHFDGRIEWLGSPINALFDPRSTRQNRLVPQGLWSGHQEPIKKIVRNANGHVLVSRTDDNNAVIWRQRSRPSGPALVRQSLLSSSEHIHRTCVIGDGKILVNLHHDGISVWDIRTSPAEQLARCTSSLSRKPLCVLEVPAPEQSDRVVYVAAIGADLTGTAWEINLAALKSKTSHGTETNGVVPLLRQFCTFSLNGMHEDVSYILPVDPAGRHVRTTGFLDVFAPDIALSYTETGTVQTWAVRVNREDGKLEWLRTSTVETGIASPSLASGSSIRKAALVDQDRTRLTIWDTSGAQLEFEERFASHDIIRDLDWTSTPDEQSILAVGFPYKVVLLSQLRYDYLDAGPSWTQVKEIRIRDLTPHPIGDSCWLSSGNLVVGAGNQLFVYDKDVEVGGQLVSQLRIAARDGSVDLFDVVTRLNGPLPVYHPQFLAQCILSDKMDLVHIILLHLHRKLKFYTEGDELDTLLGIPIEKFYQKDDTEHYSEFDDEPKVVDGNIANALSEQLMRVTLPQLSSQEQFRLVDTIECVATVEKHRRSMDANAARYLLFFRQHMLRRSQGVANKDTVSWREIVWALHSGSQDILTDLVSRQFGGKMVWKAARESGMFLWLSDPAALKAQLEIVARNEYTKSDERNPVDCSLYYLVLRKKNVLQGLWRMATWHREQAATLRLLSNNFQEPRWKTAAMKNAYALLSRHRYEYAAAFFILADRLADAVRVCINQLQDIQLAIAIARVYEGDDGPVFRQLLEERILPQAAADGNRWQASWAFWMLKRRGLAVRTLISPIESLLPSLSGLPSPPSDNAGAVPLQAKSYLSNDPALAVLYEQLREKTFQTLQGASRISPSAEWFFVMRNARLYDRMGCDLLALDLVRHWSFLHPLTTTTTPVQGRHHRRASSLVIDDRDQLRRPTDERADGPLPSSPTATKAKAAPTMFQEPDANTLLDSFGF